MANLRIYFELHSKSLAFSEQGPLGQKLPTFRQEDVLDLEISLMRQVDQFRQPMFEVETISGWGLRASVGTAGSVLASTTAFTPDATNKILTGQLSLNTAGVSALSDGADVYFELIATESTAVYGKRFPVKVEKAVFTSGALVAPPDDTALGLAQALRTFVPLDGCKGFVMESVGGIRMLVQVNDDGTFTASPVT